MSPVVTYPPLCTAHSPVPQLVAVDADAGLLELHPAPVKATMSIAAGTYENNRTEYDLHMTAKITASRGSVVIHLNEDGELLEFVCRVGTGAETCERFTLTKCAARLLPLEPLVTDKSILMCTKYGPR